MEEPTVTQSELELELLDDPTSFQFFQAVRVLEQLYPHREGVGRFVDPSDEVVRFAAHPAVAFPASEIREIESEPGRQPKLTVNFMGLTGPLGVLPLHYTMLAAERARARDPALRDFLDIFNHRMISLFYRAWQKSRITAMYEQDRRDRLTEHLLDFLGLGHEKLSNRFGVADESLLFYTGLLFAQQRPAVALEQMLADYFDVPVEIEQFVGGWYPLSASTQCLMDDEGVSSQLGVGAVVGDEVWDQQARVRVRIGPLSREQYDEFLPTGSAYQPLRALTRFFSDDQFDFEVQLILEQDEVPPCVLGAEGPDALPLGQCTWIRSAPFLHDADETVLTL